MFYWLYKQEEELLNNIQSTILQVQEDCEKLNTTTGTLIDDHRQKQRDISVGDLDAQQGDVKHQTRGTLLAGAMSIPPLSTG